MANPERGEMALAAGDRTYTMKWTTNACCTMEGLAKRTFDELNQDGARGSVTALRWLLWAALQKFHGDTVKTPEDAGLVIDEVGGVGVLMLKIIEFATLNQDDTPEGERGEPGNPPSAGATTGGVSSSTPAASALPPMTSGSSPSRNSGANSQPGDNGRSQPTVAMPS